jgi:hypothetical protein
MSEFVAARAKTVQSRRRMAGMRGEQGASIAIASL